MHNKPHGRYTLFILPITPSQGGVDSKKGHQHLTHIDIRTGIPLMRLIETESMAEIRLLCTVYRSTDCRETTSTIHIVERAFIDAADWDKKKFTLNSTLFTRMKSNLNSTSIKQRSIM